MVTTADQSLSLVTSEIPHMVTTTVTEELLPVVTTESSEFNRSPSQLSVVAEESLPVVTDSVEPPTNTDPRLCVVTNVCSLSAEQTETGVETLPVVTARPLTLPDDTNILDSLSTPLVAASSPIREANTDMLGKFYEVLSPTGDEIFQFSHDDILSNKCNVMLRNLTNDEISEISSSLKEHDTPSSSAHDNSSVKSKSSSEEEWLPTK